jgi:hypothetical protein
MTVALKNKPPVIVPPAALRRAGFKRGQDLEVKASGGVVTIVPKLSPDELQDERELCDPKIRAAIQRGHAEFLAGKTRPIESFFARRASRSRFTPRPTISGFPLNFRRVTAISKQSNGTPITDRGATRSKSWKACCEERPSFGSPSADGASAMTSLAG